MTFELTAHAEAEMVRRKISMGMIHELLNAPQQILPAQGRRQIYQSKVTVGSSREYLLRAVIDVETEPSTVVTVYRTSKILKYWRES